MRFSRDETIVDLILGVITLVITLILNVVANLVKHDVVREGTVEALGCNFIANDLNSVSSVHEDCASERALTSSHPQQQERRLWHKSVVSVWRTRSMAAGLLLGPMEID
jgi:uncharacterized membrane protein affecting hemolysin expression